MLKYKGGGFLRGVPARDLKDDEVRRFAIIYLLRSGLYEAAKPGPEEQGQDSVQEEPAQVEAIETPRRKRRSKKGE